MPWKPREEKVFIDRIISMLIFLADYKDMEDFEITMAFINTEVLKTTTEIGSREW